MRGKFQDAAESASMYFALVNVGDSLKVFPISKWYGVVQRNQFTVVDVEGLEKNLGHNELETEETETQHENDFDDKFDDDDGEEREILVDKGTELSTSGGKMQGLVKC